MAGYDKYGRMDVATLWKNGEAQRLGKEEGKANSVFVSGGDVYVAGQEKNEDGRDLATLWKNGVAKRLSGEKSEATCVFVSGGDVYVAGNEVTVEGTYDEDEEDFNILYEWSAAVLWKNGSVVWHYGYKVSGRQACCVFVPGVLK